MVDWENAQDEFYHRLRAAIIKQAVDDWRYLCRKEKRKRKGCEVCRREDVFEITCHIGAEEIPVVRCLNCGKIPDKIGNRDCNFTELTHFFLHDCDKYLQGTSLTGKMIYNKLRQEGGKNAV